MRLFVAGYPPEPALAHLAAALPPLPAEWRQTPREQWHVTLAFLGEVDERAVPELRERLARAAARTDPLQLQLVGGGTFGRNVLWVGVGGDAAGLRRLAERVTAAARRTGLSLEERAFRGHLTLARARSPRPPRPAPGLTAYAGPPFVLDEIALVRSTLGGQVRHDRLAAWRLGS